MFCSPTIRWWLCARESGGSRLSSAACENEFFRKQISVKDEQIKDLTEGRVRVSQPIAMT